jgi:glycosyltransferase involved in cell wall biosynthesis
VDHESTDDTKDVATSFGDVVKYYKHRGTFRDTFNVWRDQVRGEFVSPLDDDDYISPDCIAKLAEVLMTRNDVDIAFSRHRFFIHHDDHCEIDGETPRIDCNRFAALILENNIVPWNAVLFRTRCLHTVPKIDKRITGAFDWYFWILMTLSGFRFHQVDEVLGSIQRSHDSVENEIPRISQGALECVEYYGRYLGLRKKIAFGYYRIYGYRLIRHAVIQLDEGHEKEGRLLLLKGMANYALGLKKRLKLIPILLIWFASLITDPRKSRSRIEKLFGIYLFRNYHQIKRSGEHLRFSGLMLRLVAKFRMNVL